MDGGSGLALRRHRRSGPGRSGAASAIASALVTVLIIVGAVIGPPSSEASPGW